MCADIKLLLISDSKRFDNTNEMLKVLEQALQGGVDTIVLREKTLDTAKLLALASQTKILTDQHQARLMIHSQADIAKAVDASGVHVDASSISDIRKMKTWLGESFLISASCHDEKELKLAETQGANFAFLSPIFPTQSHPGTPSLGSKKFLRLSNNIDMPVIALGGIEPNLIPQLQGHGVATMGGILNADNPKAAAKALVPNHK